MKQDGGDLDLHVYGDASQPAELHLWVLSGTSPIDVDLMTSAGEVLSTHTVTPAACLTAMDAQVFALLAADSVVAGGGPHADTPVHVASVRLRPQGALTLGTLALKGVKRAGACAGCVATTYLVTRYARLSLIFVVDPLSSVWR